MPHVCPVRATCVLRRTFCSFVACWGFLQIYLDIRCSSVDVRWYCQLTELIWVSKGTSLHVVGKGCYVREGGGVWEWLRVLACANVCARTNVHVVYWSNRVGLDCLMVSAVVLKLNAVGWAAKQ
jgi:hypothetical protein